jgi:mannose-6-phosphate isomerase-like protein (cupin superfamily)|tara:strand:- start:230 stop:670 length:441 start_codon:yes stop_codon:yes gene_type:complete
MKENMERINTMDNNLDKYGKKELPEKLKIVESRERYWGNIKTLFADENLTVKIIEMKKGSQSSLEYHVVKDEFYYIYSGRLKLGTRIGRGENTSIMLEKGDVYHIPPGLMHMRIALEDTVIIEWSNKDDDTDSIIVEDGRTYDFSE